MIGLHATKDHDNDFGKQHHHNKLFMTSPTSLSTFMRAKTTLESSSLLMLGTAWGTEKNLSEAWVQEQCVNTVFANSQNFLRVWHLVVFWADQSKKPPCTYVVVSRFLWLSTHFCSLQQPMRETVGNKNKKRVFCHTCCKKRIYCKEGYLSLFQELRMI